MIKKSPKREYDSAMNLDSVVTHDFAIDTVSAPSPPARGRGRARGRARAAKSTAGRGRAKSSYTIDDDDDEITIIDDEPRKVMERGKCSKPRGTRGRPSLSIASAFAKQSQTSAKSVPSTVSSTPSNPSSRSSTARGVCYVSDSDE